MPKRIAVLVVVVLLIFFGYFFILKNSDSAKKKISISIRGHLFKVESVFDEKDKKLGLGKRQSLCDDCGMLFVFDRAGKYSFWMKDMLFAIDILWISNDKIVHIEKNVAPTFMKTMAPSENADQVLELNAGTVDTFGIGVGDSLEKMN